MVILLIIVSSIIMLNFIKIGVVPSLSAFVYFYIDVENSRIS